MIDLVREIKLYTQYSTDKRWISWYAKILPLKAKRTIKILKNYKKTDSLLLDVGCSTGLTLGYIAQKFKNSIGYDIDNKAIEVARKRFKKMGLRTKFILGDGNKIPLKDNSVDIVTMLEVFEHINQPLALLSEVDRVLKPDGILHITTANKLWPIEPHFHLPFLSYLPQNLADIYVRKIGKGKNYHDINLPTYGQFQKTVGQYFRISDITLEVIRDYSKYGMEKERGKIIIFISIFLRFLDRINKISFLSSIPRNFEKVLLNLSLGWLFICRPNKKAIA